MREEPALAARAASPDRPRPRQDGPGPALAGLLVPDAGASPRRFGPLTLLFALATLARGRGRAEDAAALPFTAEGCAAAARAAGEREDWAEARKWLERAHRLAPTSVHVCCNLAFAHQQMGDVDAALRLYRRAMELGDADGDAAFQGALLAMASGRAPKEVEDWLERALERQPVLVVDLDEDRDFTALEGRPRFEAARRRAWDRIGGAT